MQNQMPRRMSASVQMKKKNLVEEKAGTVSRVFPPNVSQTTTEKGYTQMPHKRLTNRTTKNLNSLGFNNTYSFLSFAL